MTVGDRLRSIRLSHGSTQEAMAQAVGLGAASWKRLELEDRVPKGEVLAQLIEMGFSSDWLIAGVGQMRQMGTGEATSVASTAPIQEDLLEHVITAVEIFLSQNNLGMHPEKKARLIVILYRMFARRRLERAAKAQEMGENYTDPPISIGGDPDIADMVRLMV